MEINKEPLDKQNLAEKKITEILNDGLYLFVKNYGKIILPFILFLTLSNFIITVFVTQMEWYVGTLLPELEAIYANLDAANLENMTESELLDILSRAIYLLFIYFLWGFLFLTSNHN